MSLFAEPRHVTDIKSCVFYHHMDLPGVGEVGRGWDLRKSVDVYLGNIEHKGKRALDMGCASGFLSFEMERRGADVVSFDMPSGASWNTVPFSRPGFDVERMLELAMKMHEQTQNAYWFCHKLLQSKAKVYYGDIYRLPTELGQFDIVMFGMILGHLRDPFQALYSGTRLCTDRVVITQPCPKGDKPRAILMPAPDSKPDSLESYHCWWALTDCCLKQILEILGFEIEREERHKHLCTQRKAPESIECVTLVGRRKYPAAQINFT